MSDSTSETHYRRPRRNIELADDVLKPRRNFADDDLGVSDKTVARMNLPTTYIGGVAHVLVNASLKIIAATATSRAPKQRVQPPRRRK